MEAAKAMGDRVDNLSKCLNLRMHMGGVFDGAILQLYYAIFKRYALFLNALGKPIAIETTDSYKPPN